MSKKAKPRTSDHPGAYDLSAGGGIPKLKAATRYRGVCNDSKTAYCLGKGADPTHGGTVN